MRQLLCQSGAWIPRGDLPGHPQVGMLSVAFEGAHLQSTGASRHQKNKTFDWDGHSENDELLSAEKEGESFPVHWIRVSTFDLKRSVRIAGHSTAA